jgi:pre-mRNA-splicing factor SYF1
LVVAAGQAAKHMARLTLLLPSQYLRIKRAVQAAFNTEASYLTAKLAQLEKGGQSAQEAIQGAQVVDPMAALDRATGTGTRVGGFVAATSEKAGKLAGQTAQEDGEGGEQQQANADEIAVDDDDDDE